MIKYLVLFLAINLVSACAKDEIFDMDYLYVEANTMQQFANIKKGQPINASGILGEVRSLGASLEDSKIVKKLQKSSKKLLNK